MPHFASGEESGVAVNGKLAAGVGTDCAGAMIVVGRVTETAGADTPVTLAGIIGEICGIRAHNCVRLGTALLVNAPPAALAAATAKFAPSEKTTVHGVYEHRLFAVI